MLVSPLAVKKQSLLSSRGMSGYNTRSSCRAGVGNPNSLPQESAGNSAAGIVTADQTQAVVTPGIESLAGSGGLENNECTMSTFAQSLKDPKIIALRAQFKAAHKSVDEKDKEVDTQIVYVQKAKDDSMPKEMIHSYSNKLDSLLTEGEAKLKTFTLVQEQLATQLDYLAMIHEDEPISRQPVDELREKVRSVFSPFKTRFSTKREDSRHLLSCLFSSESTVQPAQVQSTTMISQRKDYSYLKPRVLNFDCTRRELAKFFLDSKIWIDKALSPDDRADTRLVWASIRAILDEEWADLLGRDVGIASRDLDTVHGMMDRIYLERNPLIVQ